MNIFDGLARAYRFRRSAIAVEFEGSSYSYQTVYARALTLATNLRRIGARRGERIALFLPNCPEFIVSYYGVQAIGAVTVSLNVMTTAPEAWHILTDSGSVGVIVASELLDQMPPLEDCPDLRWSFVVGNTKGLPDGYQPFAPLFSDSGPIDERWEQLDRSAPAAILYTSGTTGKPKGATLSHGNVVSNSWASNHHTRSCCDDRVLCFLPLFHCFGQNVIMNAGINAGSTLFLDRRFDLDRVAASIEQNRITRVFGVPTVFNRLLKIDDAAKRMASVSYWFSAAAILPIETERQWQEAFGNPIYQGYGMTECSPCALHNHDCRHQPGSIGSPIENVESRIVDLDSNEVAIGVSGEITIKGPNVMLGYHHRPAETAEAIRDGWLHTGDWGYRDQDGYFYIVDRVKDMINVSGFKVWPREVEEVLSCHPSILEAAVVGVPDDDSGEKVKAVVVADPAAQLSGEQVVDLCSRHLSRYKVPKVVEFRSALPKNAAGKVLKQELRLCKDDGDLRDS
jgi:long-chain acyl-CoA synthetase